MVLSLKLILVNMMFVKGLLIFFVVVLFTTILMVCIIKDTERGTSYEKSFKEYFNEWFKKILFIYTLSIFTFGIIHLFIFCL